MRPPLSMNRRASSGPMTEWERRARHQRAWWRLTARSLTALLLSSLVLTSPAAAQDFNWAWLAGEWAESTQGQHACRSDNLHQRFEWSADRRTLTFVNDRPWPIAGDAPVGRYQATVLHTQGTSLFIQYGQELKGIPPQFREWEMRFIGPGTYRWRAVAWPAQSFNDVIGVRCNLPATQPP